ncbi:putative per-hexamer repeat protein 5 isoform X5 [Pecten maximus]|uniref:putative per-hexamer repeat protein 5 isoform X5 n=1 Tax=Pecten maximus TaxID=6579 RepID=UPI001458FE39|nr:putative per-hexamer repeat protein 5 isoform X5 [Pecten maximus]
MMERSTSKGRLGQYHASMTAHAKMALLGNTSARKYAHTTTICLRAVTWCSNQTHAAPNPSVTSRHLVALTLEWARKGSGQGGAVVIQNGGGAGSLQTGNCVDTLSNCKDYDASTCSNPDYAGWAKDNCKKTCNLCGYTGSTGGTMGQTGGSMGQTGGTMGQTGGMGAGGTGGTGGTGGGDGGFHLIMNPGSGGTSGSSSCTDKINNCAAYTNSVCNDQQYNQWVLQNCPAFCNKCDQLSSSTGSFTGTGTGTGTGPSSGTGTGTGGAILIPSIGGGSGTNPMTGTGTGTYPGSGTGTYPGSGTGTGTGTYPGSGTGTGTGTYPGSGTGTGTGTYPGSGTGTGTGTYPGSGTGTYPGSGTGTGTGTYPGSGTGTGTGTYPGSGTGTGTGTYPGSGTGTGTGTYPGSGTGTGTGTYPGSGTGTGTGTYPGSGTGSGSYTGSCADRINNCAAYGQNVCTDSTYEGWVKDNCAKTCNKCSGGTVSMGTNGGSGYYGPGGTGMGAMTGTGTGTGTGSSGVVTGHSNGCAYKGQVYQQGQTWKDGCDYRCTCTDGTQGRYSCQQLCVQWDHLPSVCQMMPPAAGKCCRTPNCPSYVQLNYPDNYHPE